MTFSVITKAQARGLIDDAFFAALIDERPSLAPEVRAIQAAQASAISREISPRSRSMSHETSVTAARVDLHRLPVITVDRVMGRDGLLGRLAEVLDDRKVAVSSLVAAGGVGKSALLGELMRRIGPDYCGAARVFGWSFYSQGSHQTYGSSSAFLLNALEFFGWHGTSPTGDEERALALVELLRGSRALLILDGIEPLQYPPQVHEGRLRDAGLRTLLVQLAREGLPNGGTAFVTSRQRLVELAALPYHRSGEVAALLPEDGAALLHHLGVRSGRHVAPEYDPELLAASQACGGHPLSLVLLGRLLVREFRGDVLRRDVLAIRDLVDDSSHTRRILTFYAGRWGIDAPEHALLLLLGVFDRPADLRELELLVEGSSLGAPLRGSSGRGLRRACSVLVDAGLLAIDHADRFDTHPLIRGWSAERLRLGQLELFQGAHRVLFEHLKAAAVPDPPSLLDVEPWIRAVHHGCLAGEHQLALDDVFYGKLLRGDEGRYMLREELGAVASNYFVASCFFDGDFARPPVTLSESDRAWLISEASVTMQALGRVAGAAALIRSNVDRFEAMGVHDNVAVSLENLVDVLMATGRLAEAEVAARQGVAQPGRTGWFFHDVIAVSRLAIVRCRRGAVEEGLRYFEAARARLAAEDGKLWLTSVNGFHHLSVLLDTDSPVDAEAWTALTLDVTRTLLDEALALLGRARWLTHAGRPDEADSLFDAAVKTTRRAQRLDYLPEALLARARYLLGRRSELGDLDRKRINLDLEEAAEIADLGGMRLYEVDLALCRARWARCIGDVEAARRALERADVLIRATDYRLRALELQQLCSPAREPLTDP